MQNKLIVEKEDTIERMVEGINDLAYIVGQTLGPSGRTVMIQNTFDQPIITKDGVTVARNVSFSDPVKNAGAAFILEAAKRTVEQVGDGTTSSTLLAQVLVEYSLRIKNDGFSVREIIKGMYACQNAVIDKLKEQSLQATEELLIGIATTSMNGDRVIGELIGKAMWELGSQASFTVEESFEPGVTIENIKGVRFDRGLQHPLLINVPSRGCAEYENPLILLTDMKINTIPKALIDIMEECARHNKPLIIMCEEMKDEALHTILHNKNRGIAISVIKIPGYGHGKSAVLEDLGALLGAKVISELRGEKLSNVKISYLGGCSKIISTKNHTIIYGGSGSPEVLQERFDLMQNTLNTTTDPMERLVIKNRYDRLKGGLMIVKVAAITPSETKELKDRLDDALNATKAAFNGVSIGGGMALINAIRATETIPIAADDNGFRNGFTIVDTACYSLFDKMSNNAELDVKAPDDDNLNIGIDFITGEKCDLIARGIVDPTSATINALTNAISVAVIMLNIGGAVINDPDDIQSTVLGPPVNFKDGNF